MRTATNYCFNLQQLRATTQAGGISGVTLKAQGDAFYVVIQTRSGEQAVLVTTQDKKPRSFKNPLRALAILRDIGIVQGHFDLSLYDPEQLDTNTPNSDEKASAQLKGTTLSLTQPVKTLLPNSVARVTQSAQTIKPTQAVAPATKTQPTQYNANASSNTAQHHHLNKQMQLL